MILPSQDVSKRLSRKKVLNNHFLNSLQKQPYGDVFANTCSGVFFNNNAAGLMTCNFFKKRLQHRCFLEIILKFLQTVLFTERLTELPLSVSVIGISVIGICRSSVPIQKYSVGWFLLGRFVDLFKIYYLHIISRNHSNALLLINLRKIKTCPK